MADKTIYTLNQIEEIIREQKYKYCNLTDITGETISPYNSINTPIAKKLADIKLKMKRQPDGVYCITCKTVYGTNAKGDKFYLGKGKQPKTLSEEPVTIKEPVTPIGKGKKDSEHLLSLENFTENIQELAELRGKVMGLEAENKRLREENADLLAELDEEPEEGVSEIGGLQGFGNVMKEVVLSAEPILDRYFNIEERKLRLAETKLLAENGYEISGAKKISGAGKVKQIARGANDPVQLPAINGEGWDEYIDHVLNLPEDKFNAHLKQLQELDQDYYNAVCAEVFTEEEEGEENE